MEGLFAPSHVVIIGVLFLVLFGAKRLPDSARALGQSLQILRAETRELRNPPGEGDASPARGQSRAPRFDVYTGLPLAQPKDPRSGDQPR